MRVWRIALLASLAAGTARAEEIPFRYEWTLQTVSAVEGPARVTAAPGGNGLVAEFGGETATLTLAPPGEMSRTLITSWRTVPEPAVVPMATLAWNSPGGLAIEASHSFEVRFTHSLRLTDLRSGESDTYRFGGRLYGNDDMGPVFGVEYSWDPTSPPEEHHGAFYAYGVGLLGGRVYWPLPAFDEHWRYTNGSTHLYIATPEAIGFNTTPEPSSLLLLSLGGVALAGWRFRAAAAPPGRSAPPSPRPGRP